MYNGVVCNGKGKKDALNKAIKAYKEHAKKQGKSALVISPTRNQVDNPRERRHLAPWAIKLEGNK